MPEVSSGLVGGGGGGGEEGGMLGIPGNDSL